MLCCQLAKPAQYIRIYKTQNKCHGLYIVGSCSCLATGTQRLIWAATWSVVWIKVELAAWKIKGPCFVGRADLASKKATGECSTAISNQRFPSGSTSFTVSPEVSRGFCSLSDSQIKRAVESDALSGSLCCPELQKPLIRFQLKWSLHCWQLSSACKLWPFLLQEDVPSEAERVKDCTLSTNQRISSSRRKLKQYLSGFKDELFHQEGSEALVHVAQTGYAVSILGVLQDQTS